MQILPYLTSRTRKIVSTIDAPVRRGRRSPPSLRLQLLVTVNGVLMVLTAAFLWVDYQRELRDRVEQKRVALHEEAKTILPAVLHLRAGGVAPVQAYLDSVCRQMHDDQSPGHHIAVVLSDVQLQATAHGRSSPERLRVMRLASSAPGTLVQLGHETLVVGKAGASGAYIYVAEEVTGLKRAVLGQILWRLGGIVMMGVIAVGLASTVLIRTVAEPVNRIVAAVTAISRGDLATRIARANSRELASIALAVNQMSEQLERAAEEHRMEMAKAREIQENLLPRSPTVPGMTLAASYNPATEVAGDYYDVLPLSNGSWLLCIADVCGHGVPAAMSAAMLKSLLIHAAEHETAPAEIMQFINRRFIALSPPGLFATMLIFRWNPSSKTLEYSSAGHEPAWLRQASGTTITLEATGFPVGIEPEATWSMQEYQLSAGDCFIATTDGISEALDPREEMFGRERIQQLLETAEAEAPGDLLARLESALQSHQAGRAATDDTTVLAAAIPSDRASDGGTMAGPQWNRRREEEAVLRNALP